MPGIFLPRTTTALWSFNSETDVVMLKFSHTPKRSRSCNGRIETSAALTMPHNQKMFPLRIRRPHLSWSNTLHKTEYDDRSADPNPVAILDLTHHGPIDVSAMNEDGHKSLRDVKADLKDYTRFTRLSKDGLEPAAHLWRLSLPVRPSAQQTESIAPSAPVAIARKHGRVEKVDEEIILGLRFKKVKRGTENARSLTHPRPGVSSAGDSNLHVDLKPLPSNFHALGK